MKQEYKFNKSTKSVWALALPVGTLLFINSYASQDLQRQIFFLFGSVFCIFINIFIWSHRIVLQDDKITTYQKLKKPSSCKWDEIEEVRDDSFLIWHLYWVMTSDRKITLWSFGGGLLLSNFGLQDYPLLLANIIVHLKSQTVVSESILRHLNMSKIDVGKYYMKNQWIESIKINSYWKEKI